MSSETAAFILGTRPEIIKFSPLIRMCEKREIPFWILHTGQHYSEDLDRAFFDDLGLPSPEYNLEVGSKPHGVQTGEMLCGIDETLRTEQPDIVFVLGDTNSAIAGGLGASKLNCELVHVESGLRSDDREMPEELNRILVDHAATYLLAPTDQAGQRLREEAIDEDRIFVTGNTIVDAVRDHREQALETSSVLPAYGLSAGEFVLMTVHREQNVSNPTQFEEIFGGVSDFADRIGMEVIYPIHPGAKEVISENDVSIPESIRLIEPQGYLDFLRLEMAAEMIVTDSGGVQEEACILGTPCITVRENTERPETVSVGANAVVGTTATDIVDGALEMVDRDGDWTQPFGDGDAAERILDVVFEKGETPRER